MKKKQPLEILTEYDFDLPDELIAVRPPAQRGDSRLLLVNLAAQTLTDSTVAELPRLLLPGDLLVFNETRVCQCRVRLMRKSGARVEALFLSPRTDGSWNCLLANPSRIKEGELLVLESGHDIPLFQVSFRLGEKKPTLIAVNADGTPAWGDAGEAEEFFLLHGEMPIPPYLNRRADAEDSERYQTIYARRTGSVAAPTAGLHFTEGIMERLDNAGIVRAFVELDVGYGTFAPVTREMVATQRLHAEGFRIGADAVQKWDGALSRRVAVGTTTLRAVESCVREQGRLVAGEFHTSLFLLPPDRPLAFHGLFTNFHLPGSSLFALVCAFGGTTLIKSAYAHAIKAKYRFYSYGDAMLII